MQNGHHNNHHFLYKNIRFHKKINFKASASPLPKPFNPVFDGAEPKG